MLTDDLKPFLKEGVKPEDVSSVIDKGRFETIKTKEDAVKLFESHDLFRAAKDSIITGSIESYKKNHFDSEVKKAVDAKILELNPEETPEQKRIKALELKLAESDKVQAEKDADLARERTLNKMTAFADEAKLPSDVKPYLALLVGKDEETSIANLKGFAAAISKIIADTKKGMLDQYGNRNPEGGAGQAPPANIDDLIKEANAKGDFVTAMRLTDQKLKK